MNILEVNVNTLGRLYEQFPNNFRGLGLDGENLTYNGEKVNISNFNINELLNGDSQFAASLSSLSSEDIFKIIRLHALNLESKLNEKNKVGNEEKIEILKEENPLMKNINIVTDVKKGIKMEYFNLVDSHGRDHLFYNDRDVDIFEVYVELKASLGREVTPDELVMAMNRKLPEIKLNNAAFLMGSSAISEDFNNKLKLVSKPFENNKNIKILGNEQFDIAIIVDLSDPTKHEVITFGTNEFGDLTMQNHKQNVEGMDTKTVKNGTETESSSDVGQTDHGDSQTEILDKKEEDIIAVLITEEEFYELINSPVELTKEQEEKVEYFYTFIGDLITYEDYLLPELRGMLNRFRHQVYELQYGDQSGNLTPLQQEFIEKAIELETKEIEKQNTYSQELVEAKVKKLELIRNNSNSGAASILQVLAIIILVAALLTIVTLYLVK